MCVFYILKFNSYAPRISRPFDVLKKRVNIQLHDAITRSLRKNYRGERDGGNDLIQTERGRANSDVFNTP